MSESIQTILAHIKSHTDKEHELHVLNPSIGRCVITHQGYGDFSQRWITNRQFQVANEVGFDYDITGQIRGTQATGKVDTYKGDGMYISKNTEMGRIILHNRLGHHVCFMNGKRLEFDIRNSADYIQTGNKVSRVNISIEEGTCHYKFDDLLDAIKNINHIEELSAANKASQEEQERLKAESERRRKEQEEEYRRIKDAQEKARIEEEHRLEEEQRQALIKAEEEKQRKLKEEQQIATQHLQELSDKYDKAASFIREQASLRLNPVLDKHQDEIKFKHMFDGCATVIDGGPGTGKTTTLIQRLRAQISAFELRDFRENHPDLAKYTNAQIDDIIAKDGGNWIFFSPTELLRQYLKDNMNYEGLQDTENKTVVWGKYLKKILRDYYHLAGNDNEPFTFKSKEFANSTLIKGNLQIVDEFRHAYIKTICADLLKIAQLEYSKFSWHIAGKIIADKCNNVQKLTSVTDIVRLMLQLERLKKQDVGGKTIAELHKAYGDEISALTVSCMNAIEKDISKIQRVQTLLSSWKNNDIDIEEIDDEEDDDTKAVTNDWLVELPKRLKPLLRKMALNTIEKQVIKDKNAELLTLIKDIIDISQLARLGELAYFNKYYYPVVNNFESYLFRRVPKTYRAFRKSELQNQSSRWNLPLLTKIVSEYKNKPLHPDEQSLLLGFINNIIIIVAQESKSAFDALKHNYSQAYKTLCRPVIGIDEATDYNLLDYYAIYSLRHYSISSFTLTGDIMQCLKPNGITEWKGLEQRFIFPQVDVQHLTISYRQSPELLNLAKQLYYNTVGESAPYTCFLQNLENVPKPLWFSSDSEEDKAIWIAKRVLEIKNNYGYVPSIAVFVSSQEEAMRLKTNMDEYEELESAGIEVKDCSAGDNLADRDMIRIFPIDQVKGMEFEVVFFHDIDTVKEMIANYLYVGLSRATFYLGITSHNSLNKELLDLKELFSNNNTWVLGAATPDDTDNKPHRVGFCIGCGKTIPFSYKDIKPILYCKDCWRVWHHSGENKDERENYCHSCGKRIGKTSYNKPLCYDCWKKEENK